MNVADTIKSIKNQSPSEKQLVSMVVQLNEMITALTSTFVPGGITDDTPVHYYEHYPHQQMTHNVGITMLFGQLKELRELIINDEDDKVHAMIDPLAPKNSTIYAISELFMESDPIKGLQKTGTWGSMWSEGSHACSIVSMTEARNAVGRIETKHLEDEDMGW